jgi:hypothetical protein
MSKQFYAIDVSEHVSGTGIKERKPVKTIALTNLNLATDLTGTIVSGYTLAAGDRFILNGQTTGTENGIYVCDTVSYRAPDFYEGDLSNSYTTVTAGDYTNTVWQITGDGTVGTGTMLFKMGTNLTYGAGDLFYGGAGGKTVGILASPPAGSVLTTASDTPAWLNQLTVALGGTGNSSATAGAIVLGNGTGAFGELAGVAYRNLGTSGTGAYENTNNAYLTTIKGPSATEQLILGFTDNVASVANFRMSNTNPPIFSVEGSGTDVTMILQAKGAGTVDLKTPGAAGQLRFWGSTSYVGLKSDSTQAAPVVFTLPVSDGTVGQVLQTNGSGVLSFTSVATDTINLIISYDSILVNTLSLTTFSYISYHTAAYGSSKTATLYFEVNYNNNFTLQVWNGTTSAQLASSSITSGGFKTLTFTTPAANSRLQFRAVTNFSFLGYSSILGMQMKFS